MTKVTDLVAGGPSGAPGPRSAPRGACRRAPLQPPETKDKNLSSRNPSIWHTSPLGDRHGATNPEARANGCGPGARAHPVPLAPDRIGLRWMRRTGGSWPHRGVSRSRRGRHEGRASPCSFRLDGVFGGLFDRLEPFTLGLAEAPISGRGIPRGQSLGSRLDASRGAHAPIAVLGDPTLRTFGACRTLGAVVARVSER